MKKIALALMFLFPAAASAQIQPAAPRQLVDVADTLQSTMTCYSIVVSSFSGLSGDATGVIRSTVTLWREAFLSNNDTVPQFFSENPNVSTTTVVNGVIDTSKLHIDIAVWPASATNPLPLRVPLAPGQQLYMVGGSVTRKSLISLCLGK